VAEDAVTLKYWTQATSLIATDGIVRKTTLEATVRGSGKGTIKTMLEASNLGGKCAELNALFVDLPLRAYSRPCCVWHSPSAQCLWLPRARRQQQLASLKGGEHCRTGVYLKAYGQVGMDPADVAKVMCQETPD